MGMMHQWNSSASKTPHWSSLADQPAALCDG
jgi:hypothetical protein